IPSGGVYIDKLVIPDGAFKNCKKLKKVGISLSECSEVEFTGKAFENAPISEFNVVNGHSDFYNPIKWTVKKNTFKKVKSGNIKVEYIMNDLASKNDIKKNSKNIRSALSKGGIKKSKIQVRYQYNGKMRKLK
nr:hypothetical protein [Lachnospiraceae bacterium]